MTSRWSPTPSVGLWHKVGDQLADDRTGVQWSIWVCDSAVGGSTLLTVTFDPGNDCMACLLMELTGMPTEHRRQYRHEPVFRSIPLVSTNAPVLADDVALLCVFVGIRCPPDTRSRVDTGIFGYLWLRCDGNDASYAGWGDFDGNVGGSGGGAYDSLLVAIRAAES